MVIIHAQHEYELRIFADENLKDLFSRTILSSKHHTMEGNSDLDEVESEDGMDSVGGDSSSDNDEEYELNSDQSMESGDFVDGSCQDTVGRIPPQQVDIGDPKSCISVLKSPSMRTFTSLNRKLKSCPSAWMEEFLVEGGLEVLLSGLDTTGKDCKHFSDAIKMLECVACIRTVMNSRIGLQVIIENEGYVQALVKGNTLISVHAHASYLSAVSGYTFCLGETL